MSNITGKYILIGQTPVPCADLSEWAAWMDRNNRVVKQTTVGSIFISTVFMGLNHNFFGKGPPVLFETMIFLKESPDGPPPLDEDDDRQWRYATWLEAEQHHNKLVEEMQRKYKIEETQKENKHE
jgi:hypothetical protein